MHANTKPRPAGVLLGGCWLAFLAAAVNTHFLIRMGISVSHLTGDLSRLGMEAVTHERLASREILILAQTLAGFVCGAAAAGFFIGQSTLSMERPYGRAVMAIGLLLLLASTLETSLPAAAIFLAATGCGFQNGLATRYRGLVLRTTHVTGILTEIGQLVGLRLGGHAVETWKIMGQAAIVFAYFAGAASGAAIHGVLGEATLSVLGAVYTLGGLVWFLLKRSGPPPEETGS